MYWLEVSVVTDGEGAEAVAEALRSFAYDGGVVLEQMGDDTDPSPEALSSTITVKTSTRTKTHQPEGEGATPIDYVVDVQEWSGPISRGWLVGIGGWFLGKRCCSGASIR